MRLVGNVDDPCPVSYTRNRHDEQWGFPMNALRFVSLASSVALTAALGGSAAADHRDLNIVSWGGAYTAAQMQAYVEPYRAQADVAVEVERYDGGLDEVAAQVSARNIKWDVIDLGRSNVERGCRMGLFEPVDHDMLPAGPNGEPPSEDFLPGMLPECAVGQNVFSNVIAYDKRRFSGRAPTTVNDFFDLRAYPGSRGMRRNPRGNLEMALMADGVPPDEVYDVLSTDKGVTRAFDKLATIAGSIAWWTGADEPVHLLNNGRVAMSTSYNGRVQTAIDRHDAKIGIIWDHQSVNYEYWAVVKGSPVKDAAMDFVRFASAAERQAELARHIAYGPARRSAMPLLEEEPKSKLPTSPAHMDNALVIDHEWWAEHQTRMERRFDAFMERAGFIPPARERGTL